MLVMLFWISLALLVYVYAGFPLLLFLRSCWRPRPVQCGDIAPPLSLIIAAYNEAAVIGSRLENILKLDYPRDRLQVLVASDGSDDGTDEIVARYAEHGIRLLSFPRRGKIATLNAAVGYAEGEILAFSDANSMCAPDALRALVRPFADPRVGGVAGRQCYSRDSSTLTASGERTYWKFDQMLKTWQSRAGSVTSATGALYAIRRHLFSSIPAGVCDDMVVSYRVVAQGYRLVYEPRALATECVAASSKAEFQRKVRICAQGFRSVLAVPELLDPFRYGFYSLQLFSHKVLRWMAPWPLMVLLLSTLGLARSAVLYRGALAAETLFYGAALLFAFVPEKLQRRSIPRVLTLPFFFCLAYAGSLKAQWLTLRGARCDLWNNTRQPRPKTRIVPVRPIRGGRIAYLMSRFPKITETFILYEFLQLRRQGEAMEIYPLMHEREPVTHPEAKALVEQAHFQPFISAAIVRANWYYLRRRPRAYLGAIAEVLRGTFGSANFFAGAIVFFPKSAAFAYEMERSGVTHVHAHFATHPALSALIIHRLTGIPFSFTAHGHDIHCDRRMLREKLRAAAFAITISRYNRDLMIQECGADTGDKIHVIHCGVDTAYFVPAANAAAAGPLRIICVASLLQVKGHAYLVEACRLLRERGISFQCDLVGTGELRSQIESQVERAGLGDAFSFHGAQPRSVVRSMLQHAHVKVLPSVPTSNGLREGIPVALMEAMACGLPVVSSALSGIPELVEHEVSGILVPPGDSTALANALERLALDPRERERLGAAARQKVLREFDMEANAAALAALFGESSIQNTATQTGSVAA